MRLGYIYGLPKVHKCKLLKQLIEQNKHIEHGTFHYKFNDLKIPFRPILSGTRCPLKRLCELSKIILRPFEKRIPHLIIDTYDFLRKLPHKVEDQGQPTLVAIDIVQLYPSINNELGLEALKYWFEKFPEEFTKHFTKEFTLELIKLIQNNVYFTFNDHIYQQIQGTAMGKDHAPPYANLTIAYLIIEKLYPTLDQLVGRQCVEHVRENLKFFLDDGVILLNENIIQASTLLECLNKMNTNIQFTMETSTTEVPFLDVLIKSKQDPYKANTYNISTDIYHKPTDAFNYFPFNSCAPGHIGRNIPYNLTRRIATIVSEEKTRNIRFNELIPRLLSKKYPIGLINDSIKKAKTLKREVLLRPKPQENKPGTEIITLVLEHNPQYIDPSKKIANIVTDLVHTDKIKASNSEIPKIINARKQPLNLLRLLSLSKKRDHNLNELNNNNGEFIKCGNKQCLFCKDNAIVESTYTTKNGTTLKRNVNMTCKTMDLIYLLMCTGCREEYLGETGCTIAERTNLHRSQIKIETYRKLKVSKHVHNCSNGQFKIFPFHKCSQQSHIYREEMEMRFRNLVNPKLH